MRRNKGGRSSKVFSFFLLPPLIILAGILIYSNWKIIRERKELLARKEELGQRVERLKEEKAKLEKGLSESETEDYWEERIRNQGYKKPEEEVVVVKREEGGEEASQPVDQEATFWQSFLAEIQSFF